MRYEKRYLMKNVLQSKEFWKTMRPVLSYKNTVFSQISIEKNTLIISNDFNLSEEFRTFFEDAIISLNVKLNEYYLSGTENLSDPVLENLKNIRVLKLLKFH